jgi:tRNA threonylcarbamoyladenosine biosynthesis protein TsaB
MIILAMDSSTSACSAAVIQGGAVRARRLAVMARGQSEALMPMLRDVMAEAGLDFAALDLLAVTVGPGAFTGIRIGLAAARGLALGLGLPLAGLSTLQAVAAGALAERQDDETLVVAVDSRRHEAWVQAFGADLEPLGDIAAMAPGQLAAHAAARGWGRLLLAGDAATRLAEGPGMRLAQAAGWPDAVQVARLAADHWAKGTALPPEPLYLRDADVTL